jgi:hypothetical protein
MFQLSRPQIGVLRVAIEGVYAGPFGSQNFAMFLSDELAEDLYAYTSAQNPFPIQAFEALVALNVNRATDLLNALEKTQPVLVPVINQLRAPLPAGPGGAAERLRALEDGYLLLEGLPFINRGRLREILGDLLDSAAQARVGIVAGASLSGKSWSLHLIRAFCKSNQNSKIRRVLLDLEKLQPGNDPVVAWTELMKQLLYPQPPPPAPAMDTKGGQYVQRLVGEVLTAWESQTSPDEERPWLLIVFDHLDKNAAAAVGPAVVDFAEALALAAAGPALERVRVLLLGFPRAFSLSVEEVAPREELAPLTMDEVRLYLDKVGKAIGRGATPETEAAAELALREVEAKTAPEERRAALLRMSATIGRHVTVLARA